MITDITLNKVIPASNATVLEIGGANPDGFSLTLSNQDTSSTLVYKLQESSDGGSTWADIAFPVTGGTTHATFTTVAGASHSLRVVATSSKIRLQAYGDLMAMISLQSHRNHSLTESTQVTI